MLTANSVDKRYGSVTVLNGASLRMEAGDTVALTGESGSGKSTLLHIIAGLDSADGGQILVDGADVTKMADPARATLRREVLAIVFQQFNLIPSLDIGANIAFQARLAGRHQPQYCADLTARLGLADLLHRYPEQISGGQAQRVAIARALAVRPKLLLADEPTGNLDQVTGDGVLDIMLELVSETDTALLMVTHSDRLARRLSQVITLRNGELA